MDPMPVGGVGSDSVGGAVECLNRYTVPYHTTSHSSRSIGGRFAIIHRLPRDKEWSAHTCAFNRYQRYHSGTAISRHTDKQAEAYAYSHIGRWSTALRDSDKRRYRCILSSMDQDTAAMQTPLKSTTGHRLLTATMEAEDPDLPGGVAGAGAVFTDRSASTSSRTTIAPRPRNVSETDQASKAGHVLWTWRSGDRFDHHTSSEGDCWIR